LPAATLVGTAGWAIMHHEDAFPDPFVFRPERWIVDEKNGVTPEEVDRAKLALNPFSAGPDNCVGQKLAMLELLIAFGRVLYRMDVRALPGNRTGEERLI
jgi:cytochrome P450